MDLPPSDSSGASGASGAFGDTPSPPYSLGDPLAVSSPAASTEALRGVLARHRRRQLQVLGGVLTVALLAGSIAGFAIGRQGRAGVTRLAAGSQPTDSSAASSGAGGSAAGVSSGWAVSSGVAPSAAMLTGKGAVQSSQLLVRNAKDGTRVRLYEETFPMPVPPPPPCKNGTKGCPEIATGNAMPTKTLLAEVSDDQVAGQAGTPQWEAAKTSGFDPLAAEVVGAGQPQPILVVLAHAPAGVTTVEVTTPYGSDSAAPGPGGWVALAVRLPADYVSEKLPSDPSVLIGVPSGTVTARSASGAAVDSITLGKLATKLFGPCDSANAAAKAAANAAAKAAAANAAAANAAGTAAASAAGAAAKPGTPASASGGTPGSAAGSSAASSNAAPPPAAAPPATASAPPTVSCGGFATGGSSGSSSSGSASTGSGSSGSGSSSSASVAPATPAAPATP